MFKQLRRAFWEYVKENLGIYTLVVLFFLAGIIMGSVLVRILAESQLIELGTTISYFLESLKMAVLIAFTWRSVQGFF